MRLPKLDIKLILVLLIVFLLRVPTLTEPYWYGDEGIYLAIGQALNRGAVLYRDIWDNKTPLLYLLYAINPTLLWAKISATVFVLGTCLVVYFLSKRLFSEKKFSIPLSLGATTLVGIFLSIPLLEGTIANAELYFTLPIILGAYLIYRYSLSPNPYPLVPIFIGFLASVAFLLKVPALFDFLGMFVFLAVVHSDEFFQRLNLKSLFQSVKDLFRLFLPTSVAFLVPILGFFAYFYFQHALNDYLVAAFSQNASYVAVDTGPLSKLNNPLFIKGLLLLLTLLISLILFIKKIISKELLFLILWFGFSLYGALLSGRPYMHYLLQIVPPAVLLIAYLFLNLKKYWPFTFTFCLLIFALVRMFNGAFALSTIPYYQNWISYMLQEQSFESYASNFDRRTPNTYHISSYLRANTFPNDPLFVWGDAAYVYVLSDRPPATKFIQAHHLTTIDPKNYDLVYQRLEKIQPKYIVVSRPTFSFPKLESLLERDYTEIRVFDYLHVYKNNRPVSSSSWSINY